MFKLNCILVSSVRSLCRQVAVSLNATGSAVNIELQRTLCSSSERHQGAADFRCYVVFESSSHLPPLPGQESSLRWAGKKFEELPIVHIKATYNNTHIQMTDSAGESLVRTSCGTEGFKNIKKSTPVAAQTAGISAASKATAKGVTFVRVVIKGIGPGRQSAIKGLTMGGLEVVSITDNTPVPHNGCRPRKARRT
ncbi:28S ribosomal protein S11, mitochondrial [Labrus mixtus]|uniref:28S ribosomal protein S11, mitochondrial n=1 Tax=Labrus mixtus TaxID=508554 RepID=UPI0029C0091A|nr:28S ribosomal protein S11, mitochondrial [Labrus mixtus]